MTKSGDPMGNEDSELESLLAAAGPRRRPQEDARQEAFEALSSEWQELVSTRRRRRRRTAGFAIAASLVAVLSLVFTIQSDLFVTEPQSFGQIARVSGGELEIFRDGTLVSDGLDALQEGDSIVTGDGSRVLVHLSGGGSVRIDQNSRAELAADSRLHLQKGAVYFDSLGGSDTSQVSPLTVETPAGVVSHLGTQYMARVDRSATAIGVREGRVSIRSPGTSSIAESGQLVKFNHQSRASTQPLSSYASAWDWVMEIAPYASSQRATPHEILGWIARESGREVVYAEGARVAAENAQEIDGLPDVAPLTALDALEVASGLQIEVAGPVIHVRVSSVNGARNDTTTIG